MKSVNRKLEQFIKSKEVSAKKSQPITPHLTYKVTHLPTASTVNTSRKSASRNFSMTVSFYNPRFEKNNGDHIVRHESHQVRINAASPERIVSPKRNPILQNNREPVHDPKPSIRCISTSNIAPSETDEYMFLSKAKGDYNYVHNAVNFEPRAQGKRTNLGQMLQGNQEVIYKARKGIKNSSMQFMNPITEGHPNDVKLCKKRSPPEISEETKRLNDRKQGLSLSLVNAQGSPKGKVFWDTSITLGGEATTERSQQKSIVPVPKRHRRSDSMKEVIGYEYSLPYRDQAVTGKCTNMPFYEMVRTDEY